MHHVVAGPLVESGRVLLGYRSPSRRWYPDVWDLPGGHVVHGESETQTLSREMWEELGVQVLAHDPEPLTRLHLNRAAGTEALRLSVWRVRKWNGDPVNRSDEHANLDWFGVEDLDSLVLAHPGYRQLLRAVLSKEDTRDGAAR